MWSKIGEAEKSPLVGESQETHVKQKAEQAHVNQREEDRENENAAQGLQLLGCKVAPHDWILPQ